MEQKKTLSDDEKRELYQYLVDKDASNCKDNLLYTMSWLGNRMSIARIAKIRQEIKEHGAVNDCKVMDYLRDAVMDIY